MITHIKYPPRLALAINIALGKGALLIERRGIIQMNLKGKVLLIAYRSVGIWIVELPHASKTVSPVEDIG